MSGFVCSRMSLRMSASHLGIRHGLSEKLCKPCSPCSNEGNEDLGNWEAHRGRELHTLDGVRWSVTLQSKSQIQIEYKYVRMSECSGKRYTRWEHDENRRFHMKHSCVVNEAERSFGGLCRMSSMKPMEKATQLMTKLTEEHKGLADKMSMIQVAVKERQLSDLNNLHSQVASGVSSNPCNVNDLQPGSCPPGLTTLVALKKKAENGRAQCMQTFEGARDRLTELKTEADEIADDDDQEQEEEEWNEEESNEEEEWNEEDGSEEEWNEEDGSEEEEEGNEGDGDSVVSKSPRRESVADLARSLRHDRIKELARLKKQKVLCQQVAGTPDDIKGIR